MIGSADASSKIAYRKSIKRHLHPAAMAARTETPNKSATTTFSDIQRNANSITRNTTSARAAVICICLMRAQPHRVWLGRRTQDSSTGVPATASEIIRSRTERPVRGSGASAGCSDPPWSTAMKPPSVHATSSSLAPSAAETTSRSARSAVEEQDAKASGDGKSAPAGQARRKPVGCHTGKTLGWRGFARRHCQYEWPVLKEEIEPLPRF